MKFPFKLSGIVAVALLPLAGCVAQSPNLDSRFGDSVRFAQAQQTLHPEASADTRMVAIDGQAAHEIVGRYIKSYSTPTPQPNVFTIGIGSGGSR